MKIDLETLSREGLTNDLLGYNEIIENSKVVRIFRTYCSSFTCSSQTTRKKGSLVLESDKPALTCPKCSSPNFLFIDSKRIRVKSP